MVLVVHEYGASVGKRGNCILVKTKSGSTELCADKVTALQLYPASSITSDAVRLCIEKDIQIVFMEYNGSSIGEVQSFSGGCAPVYKRKQLSLIENQKGVEIAKSLLISKLYGRIRFLRKLRRNKRKTDTIQMLDSAIGKIEEERARIQQCTGNCIADVRYSLQGYEGTAGRAYFEAIAGLLPEEIGFSARSRNAEDVYNNALNYLNGILYARLKHIVYQCRLDPYIGIMHMDAYNRPTFVFDLIEGQRYICEELAFRVCSERVVTAADMEEDSAGRKRFNKAGRQKLTASFCDTMQNKCCYKKKHVTQEKKIQLDILEIARQIAEEEIDVLPVV